MSTSGDRGHGEVTWAFIDECGNTNLATEIAGVSEFFIVAAVVLSDRDVDAVRAAVEPIRRLEFQTGEMKSSGLKGNRKRWYDVLRALGQVPFHFYGLVVDKRAVERTSGLQWKTVFYKNICGKAYGKLMRAYPSLKIRADRYGDATFQESFTRYICAHHRPSLFQQASVEFVDSKQDVLVQLADILGGLLARCYSPEHRIPKPEELLGLVLERALLIDQWPPRLRVTSGTTELAGGSAPNDHIASYSLRQAEDFIIRHEQAREDDLRSQVAVLERLVFERRFGEGDRYITTGALLDNLRDRGLGPKGETWFRMSVIAPLRDHGLLLTSSPSGYKLPTCPSDLASFAGHAQTVCVPMLKRVKAACGAVTLATKGEIDVLKQPGMDAVRRLVDALPSIEERDSASEKSDG